MNINKKFEKNKTADTLLLLSAGSLFIWGIICSIIRSVSYEPSYGEILLNIIIILIALRIIFFNRFTAAVFLITGFITAILIYSSVYTNPHIAELAEETFIFLKDFCLYIGGYVQYNPAYESVARWGLCIIISVFVFVFTTVSFEFFTLPLLAFVTFGIIFSSGGLVYTPGFLACIFGIIVYLTEYFRINRLKKVSDTQQKQNKIVSAILGTAIAFLCIGGAYIIPAPESGFKDILADTIILRPLKAANKYITSFFAPKYFSLSATGYMRKDRILGGDALLDDEIVMEVRARGRERVYLTGKIYDTYTGYSWENTLNESQPYFFYDGIPETDFIEMMFSNLMMSLDNGEFDPLCSILEIPERIFDYWYAERCEYIEKGTMTIQMQQSAYASREIEINIKDARTFSVFSNNMTVDITHNGVSQSVLRDGQGNLSVKKLMPKNTVYTIHYKDDPAISYWSGIKSYSRKGIYKEILDALTELHEKYDFSKNQISISLDETFDMDEGNLHMFKMYPEGEMYYTSETPVNYEDILTSILIPRAEEIYSVYTSLPENFPKRIEQLTRDIISNTENDYTKAVKIMNYLKSRYPYTLTPGETPEGCDFADYFLFDLQEGYCTYFASAFVTMCRSIGLPARYVEGYVSPDSKNEDGIYVVTHKEGHAWGEVYFEGYGWIQFESTPPDDSAGVPDMLPSSEQYLPDQYEVRDLYDTDNTGSDNTQSFLSEESHDYNDDVSLDTGTYTPVDNPSIQEIIFSNLAAAIIFITLSVILFMTMRVIYRRLSEKKILNKSNREAVILYFYILMKYLRFLGYEKMENETVNQYITRCRIEDKFPSVSKSADIFSKAFYSVAEISESERNILIFAANDIDANIRSSLGKVKYFYFKYVSGFATH